jgi:hypothetical protein
MKLVHLVGFIVKKFVTMRSHMNVKLVKILLCKISSIISNKTYKLKTTIIQVCTQYTHSVEFNDSSLVFF